LAPSKLPCRPEAPIAVYTAGYEGASIDSFLDGLLRAGIHAIGDVRANPVSRKYGFAGSSMRRIAGKLGLTYEHFPMLGIPSASRKGLGDTVSHEDLFDAYERDILSREPAEIERLARCMAQRPMVLVCMEKAPEMCHRSRLAKHVARAAGLPVQHLQGDDFGTAQDPHHRQDVSDPVKQV
jgi:uncharacterized protein (DUF488 family)